MPFVCKCAFASAFQIVVETHIINYRPPPKLLRASYDVDQVFLGIAYHSLTFWHNTIFVFTLDHVLATLSKNFVKPKYFLSPLGFIIFKWSKVWVRALELISQSFDLPLSRIMLRVVFFLQIVYCLHLISDARCPLIEPGSCPMFCLLSTYSFLKL